MIRLLLVDDSTFMLNVIKKCVESEESMVVAGTAKNGLEAIEKIKALKPDCVTMDINMPVLDGLNAVKEIMSTCPVPIIMLSAYSAEGAELTVKALEYGAFDFIQKPDGEMSTNLDSIKYELIRKIFTAMRSKVFRLQKDKYEEAEPPAEASAPVPHDHLLAEAVVAIGISTGGPRTLREILPLFKPEIRAAVIVSQHMPAQHTSIFAKQLDKITKLAVVEAANGMRMQNGTVYICPGGNNLSVKGKIITLEAPSDSDIYVPSVDRMFYAAAAEYRQNCIGIVMTGMGNDGTRGIAAIRENKGLVIAQDESSSIVFGMPKSAIETKLVDIVLPARLIPGKVNRWVEKKFAEKNND